MEDAKRKTERFSSDFETKANVLSDEIKEGQKKMQNEYITILGIFAAIVLAFTWRNDLYKFCAREYT